MQNANFCIEYLVGASSWWDPRMTALEKTKDVFTVSSPMCCFQTKIETRNGLRDVNKFVYKPTKWVTNSKGVGGRLMSQMFKQQWTTLSQTHCDGWRKSQDCFCIRTRACEHSASSITTADVEWWWISELELQFAGPSPNEPILENAANQWADDLDDHT